jgi:hypothetical protein
VSADQPLTGDELAAIKATALRLHGGEVGYFPEHIEPRTVLRLVDEIERLQAGREMEQRALANALPLVAEVERLRAQVERAVSAGEHLAEALSSSQREVELLKADYASMQATAERAVSALERGRA